MTPDALNKSRYAMPAALGLSLLITVLISCTSGPVEALIAEIENTDVPIQGETQEQPDTALNYGTRLAQAALQLTADEVRYDPSYFSIAYPGGDVPAHLGVCTDVVIRAYRALGLDLQKAVHEDMKSHFSVYPKIWGLKTTDTNIDHRRVPNLMTYMDRQGAALSISQSAEDYLPGDVVCWSLGGGLTHIGIVIGEKSFSGIPLIVHNIGAGQVKQNCLFDYSIIGHYRYAPAGQ